MLAIEPAAHVLASTGVNQGLPDLIYVVDASTLRNVVLEGF